MNLVDILRAIKKYWIVELIIIIVVAMGGAYYAYTIPNVYSASTQVYVSYQASHTTSDPNAQGDSSEQYSSGLSDYSVSSYVSQQMDLIPTLINTPAVQKGAQEKLGGAMNASVTATTASKGYFVTITGTSSDPKAAADAANAVSESLADQFKTNTRTDTNIYIPENLRLSVVTPASTPSSPSSPNRQSIIVKSILAGIVVALCVALGWDLADNRIRQPEEAQRITHAPISGSLPKDAKFEENGPLVALAPASGAAEAVRRLALNLTFLNPDKTGLANVFAITSNSPSEGKTTVSINLAAAFAERGAKVLLVGTDLRHPSIAKRMDINGAVGLSHVITQQMDADTVIQKYWKPNFHVLPAGERVSNPSVLINSQSMETFLKQASSYYDYVILDTEPISVANDAVVFAKAGANLVFVVAEGVTNRRHLQAMMREFKSVNVDINGLVINMSDVQKEQKKYYGHYYSDAQASKAHHKATLLDTSSTKSGSKIASAGKSGIEIR